MSISKYSNTDLIEDDGCKILQNHLPTSEFKLHIEAGKIPNYDGRIEVLDNQKPVGHFFFQLKTTEHIFKYELLIINEIGYLPVDKHGANLFFQLIAKRYEKHSTIITTNINFAKWGDMFDDAMLANAILDRLLHHSTDISIKGTSYRIKDKIEKTEREETNRFIKTYKN